MSALSAGGKGETVTKGRAQESVEKITILDEMLSINELEGDEEGGIAPVLSSVK